MLPSMPTIAKMLHQGFLVSFVLPAIARALACQGVDEPDPVMASRATRQRLVDYHGS